jgi:hypothetical protein
MAKFKQDQIIPGVTKTRSNALKVYCGSAIAANDIIVATGVQGDFMSVVPADANLIARCRGPFFVADFAGAAGEYLPLAIPYKVVTGVDTSTSLAGEPVWLDITTAGGITLGTIPAAAVKGAQFIGAVKVGRILSAASSGAYLLEPGPAANAPLCGRVTLGGTSTTVLFGGTNGLELIGCPVVATPAGAHGTYTTAITAVMESDGSSGGRLALTHPSASDVCSFMIQC